MSIIKNLVSKNAGAAADVPMLEPEQVIEQLRTMKGQIPQFVQLPNDREMKQIRRMAALNVEFVRQGMDAAGASEVVQSVIGNTSGELHQAEDIVARWLAVETELRAVLRGVTAGNLVLRARIGQAAMQAYKVSRELVRQDDHAHLLPHVEIMSRMPKYGRRRVKAAAAAEPQPPQTPAKPVS
jgi:hypothetical protein